MSDIEEHAKALGEAVAELDEYEALVEAEEQINNDPDVREQFQKTRELQNKLVVAHQEDNGHDEHEELHEQYEKAQRELNQMDAMQEYNEAAAALNERLQEVNEHISEELVIDFATFAEPAEQQER